ncbi:unnamed protein product [Darwinula stevensoni]|uniref:[histone H3]-dimethyl-L-lysine(9) demethylase n=1 Tax=Darwinula stevensoni TaxID=69355 RepID=A0A7R8X363_9CRUS|nr:unnamed protein product [Darwinula stevensoni]CAG0878489.1 unnamed protein product [Darwinula stevensoni]
MPKENKKIGNAILNYGEKKSIPRKRKVKTQDAAECDKGISEIPVKKRKPSGGRQKSKKFTWENADKVIISQDETCAKLVKIFPEFPCCQDCADLIKRKSTSTYCRFIKFRKLHMMDDKLQPAGLFSLEDAKATSLEKQAQLWMPLKSESNGNGLSCEKATFYLKHVGDEFCKLLMQQISQMEETKDKKRAWKMVEEQVREMCDVCQTTIFNIHWVCEKCGFMACSDCFNDRKEGSAKMWLLDDEKARTMNKDIFSWMLCTDGSDHDIDELAQAHVIPSIEILRIMSTKLHSLRKEFHVSLDCPCMVKEEASSEANDRLCETREDGLIKEDTPAQETEIAKMGENPIMKHENEMEGKEKVMLSSCGKTLGLPALAIKNAFPLMKWENQTEENSDKEVSLFGKALGIPSRKVVESGEVPTKKQEFAFCTYLQRKGGTFQKEEDITDERDGDSVSSEDFVESMTQEFLGMLARPRNDQQQQASEQEEQMDCHQWLRGHPVIVSNVDHHLNMDLWTPASFCEEFGNQKHELVNCLTGRIVSGKKMKKFWAGFEDVNEQLQDTEGRKMLLKLKDWPPAMDFKDLLPSRFDDLMQALPLGEYTIREGVLNLSSRLPNIFVKPDLGPKMYIAYGSTVHPSVGTTNLHLDISDAVNVMVHTGIPEGVDREKVKQGALKALQEGGCDYLTLRRVREKGDIPGALWHIYHPEDADKIRDLLNRISVEKGKKISWQEDPIHDQATYLDTTLRNRLYYDYKVTGYAIAQCLGDAVFIPAGAPHQVQNLHNCIKVAEDFVSPENVTHCFHLTQEFRHLSDTHSNHEDKLQIKNILYHAMKDAISLLSS